MSIAQQSRETEIEEEKRARAPEAMNPRTAKRVAELEAAKRKGGAMTGGSALDVQIRRELSPDEKA
eukprot:2286077-Alexandrium_andersonii.AAC.1